MREPEWSTKWRLFSRQCAKLNKGNVGAQKQSLSATGAKVPQQRFMGTFWI